MRCPNCNNEIADNSTSCVFCATKSSALGHTDDIEETTIGVDQPRTRPVGFPKGGTIILSFAAGILLAGLGLWGYWLVGNGGVQESNTQPIEIEKPLVSAEGVMESSSILEHQPNPNQRHASKEEVSASSGTNTPPNHGLPASEPLIHPAKMDVLYRGVYNPINIRVPGYEDKDLSVTATNGTLEKDARGWGLRPGTGPTTSFQVSLTNPDGSTTPMGGVSFRVKNVPNPQPYFAGKSFNDETIQRTELSAAEGIVAKLVEFDFDLKFEVVEFRLAMIVSGTPIEMRTDGSELNNQMKELLAKAKPGQKLYIEGVKARGPDGIIRHLGALAFKIN